jgi:anti-sigma regulatory factor (Ser/Thr protein kinase)
MPEERQTQATYRRRRPSVPAARRDAAEVAEAWGLEHLADDLMLIVSELVTNAVVHGTAGRGRHVTVTYLLTALRLRVEVRDPADGIPQQAGTAQGGDAEPRDAGRGLPIIEALTSRWGFEPKVIGKTVWCEFDLKADDDAEAREVVAC